MTIACPAPYTPGKVRHCWVIDKLQVTHMCITLPQMSVTDGCVRHLIPIVYLSLLSHWQITSYSHVRHFTSNVSHCCVRHLIPIVFQVYNNQTVYQCVSLFLQKLSVNAVTVVCVNLHELHDTNRAMMDLAVGIGCVQDSSYGGRHSAFALGTHAQKLTVPPGT